MRIRPEADADHAVIGALVETAFGSTAEATLVARIRATTRYRPELTLVAEVDGLVVGHVMVSDASLVNDAGTRPIAILAPLSVAPAHQGRGIGSVLVETVCALADAAGEPLVVLEGSPRYYTRFGFEPSYASGIEMPLPGGLAPEVGQVLRLATWNDSWRGRVEYPPAFDLVT